MSILTFLERLLLPRAPPAEGPYEGTRFLPSFVPQHYSTPHLLRTVYFRVLDNPRLHLNGRYIFEVDGTFSRNLVSLSF